LIAGIYTCTITDQNGCSVTSAGVVNEPSDITFSSTAEAVKCIGDANGVIHVSSQGGTPPFSYSATLDGTNFIFAQNGAIPNLAIGDYTIIIADNNGCTKVDTVAVPNASADVFAVTTDSTSCYGSDYNDGAVHILALSIQNGPYQYSIDGGASQYSRDFYTLTAGNHTIHAVSFRAAAYYCRNYSRYSGASLRRKQTDSSNLPERN
jgi:guanyl-specific ribonuclease Sa